MKIKRAKTNRGFQRNEFKDYDGKDASIQESSLADANCIWLGLNEGTHHHVTGECLPRMHLSQKQARDLANELDYFASFGVLPDETVIHKSAYLERNKAIYWLLRLFMAQNREGWEEGQTENKVRDNALSFLANLGLDPYINKGGVEAYLQLCEKEMKSLF